MSYMFSWLHYIDSGTLALLNIALLPIYIISWRAYNCDRIVNLADIFSLALIMFDVYMLNSYLKLSADEFYNLLALLILIELLPLFILFIFFCKICLYLVDSVKARYKKSNRENNKWWNSLTEEERKKIKDTTLLRSSGVTSHNSGFN